MLDNISLNGCSRKHNINHEILDRKLLNYNNIDIISLNDCATKHNRNQGTVDRKLLN